MTYFEKTINNESYSLIILESDIKQIGKKEDYIEIGNGIDNTTNESFDYIWVNDGHGGQTCINIIKKFGYLKQNVCCDKPMDKLYNIIRNYRNYTKLSMLETGAMSSLVKIYKNQETGKGRAVFTNVGDCEFIMLINEKIVYHTKVHKPNNENEMKRLREEGFINNIYKIDTYRPCLLSDDSLFMKKSTGIKFNGFSGPFTQSLGHNELTGFSPSEDTIEFDLSSHVKIVGGSDGLWDLFCPARFQEHLQILNEKNASELTEYAKNQWTKTWKCYETSESPIFSLQAFPSYDDICCGVWEQIP
jgi:serine/threonine protein phosphatase PrpC